MNEEQWTIKDDKTADWAIEKIKEHEEDRDRLLSLIKEKRQHLDEKEQQVKDDFKYSTSNINEKLFRYFETVEDKAKEQKTQFKYDLLSGSLILKKSKQSIKKDNEKLLEYLKSNNKGEFIKISESIDWANYKKTINILDDGLIADLETGEILEDIGLNIEITPEEFEVK